MELSQLSIIVQQLISLPQETEWVEFKQNNEKPETIGEYISALSNSATLHGENTGYLVWGIEDNTRNIVGTQFKPKQTKIGNEELENWLLRLLFPRINFKIYELTFQNQNLVLLEIPSANYQPVSFQGIEYIRVGSYKKKLKDYPEKERELWNLFSYQTFEKRIALENITADEVLTKINYPSYFELTKQNLPDNKQGILERLEQEKLINIKANNYYDITNIDAVEFFQLPAPDFSVKHQHTEAVLLSYRELKDMDKSDRMRACYQHACLRFVCREQMTNESLR
ncbi:MAG: helix-turn-helix domain-containing protein, partial [Dolichospermum sp.]